MILLSHDDNAAELISASALVSIERLDERRLLDGNTAWVRGRSRAWVCLSRSEPAADDYHEVLYPVFKHLFRHPFNLKLRIDHWDVDFRGGWGD